MKLAAVLLASLLASGVARADETTGPPGMSEVSAPPPRAQRRAVLRQMIIQRFDRNHDGQLGPVERRQAARALRRLARMLMRQQQGGRRMRQRIINKYDLNGDGNVGPGEMPPAMAKRLRRLDRNGDGWLDERDQQ